MRPPPGRRDLPPSALLVLGFLAAILLGALLLWSPQASRGAGRIPFIDALFTSTSATCVTGLIVLDTGSDFSRFGQTVILALIQAGGLGIMTVSTFFLLLLGRRISIRDQAALRDALGGETVFRMGRLVAWVVATTVCLELLGWGLLYLGFSGSGLTPSEAAFSGLFHSVSAFCNAGFSLQEDSLCGLLDRPLVYGPILGLFIAGGLGYVVLLDLAKQRPWRTDRISRGRLTLQSKVVLSATAALGIGGACLFLALEWHRSLVGLPMEQKMAASLFQSFTPRTAGFNVVPVDRLGPSALLLTLILMFIGASPGSTGGGIKTCSLVVLLGVCRTFLKAEEEVVLFHRTVPRRVIRQAICIAVISLCLICLLILFLLMAEGKRNGMPFEDLVFEAFSAFGTVGLSRGITAHLSVPGKLIIILTMFIGRIGPLTLALLVSKSDPSRKAIRHPEQAIMVG